MIDLNKKYKTIKGLEVNFFAIFNNNVFGIINNNENWIEARWSLNGEHSFASQFDLVEVVEPIEHSAWVNVYNSGISFCTYNTKESADRGAGEGRIDCIKIKYSKKK